MTTSKQTPEEEVRDRLRKQADAAMETHDYETAVRLYRGIVDSLRRNQTTEAEARLTLAEAWSRYGEACVASGDWTEGRAGFAEALSTLPSEADEEIDGGAPEQRLALWELRAGLHLYWGQLQSSNTENDDSDDGGAEALTSYQKGIADYERCLQLTDSSSSSANDITQKLRSAHCAVAELYMATDLCWSETAEVDCEAAVQSALALDGSNGSGVSSSPEAHQTMASLRLSQGRPDDAADAVWEAFRRMEAGCVEATRMLLGSMIVDEERLRLLIAPTETSFQKQKQTDDENDPIGNLPPYEFRCQTARLLLECGPTSRRCYSAAVQVLGSLLAEDDGVVDTWILRGCAFEGLALSDANDKINEEQSKENENNGSPKKRLLEAAQYHWEVALQTLESAIEELAATSSNDDMEDDEERMKETTLQREELMAQRTELQEKLTQLSKTMGGILESNNSNKS